jgi:hypothetical protein
LALSRNLMTCNNKASHAEEYAQGQSRNMYRYRKHGQMDDQARVNLNARKYTELPESNVKKGQQRRDVIHE